VRRVERLEQDDLMAPARERQRRREARDAAADDPNSQA
jgi:hypothetical protein